MPEINTDNRQVQRRSPEDAGVGQNDGSADQKDGEDLLEGEFFFPFVITIYKYGDEKRIINSQIAEL